MAFTKVGALPCLRKASGLLLNEAHMSWGSHSPPCSLRCLLLAGDLREALQGPRELRSGFRPDRKSGGKTEQKTQGKEAAE